MANVRGDASSFSAILLERGGRFYMYEPGTALIASGADVAEAYAKFAQRRSDFFEEARRADLELHVGADHAAALPSSMAAAKTFGTVPVARSFGRELGLFLAKFVIVIGVLGGLAGIGVWKASQSLDRAFAGSKPLSLDDVARKSEEIARDIRRTPDESKELLRRSIAALSRALDPLVEAWRQPQGIPEPVRPPPKAAD